MEKEYSPVRVTVGVCQRILARGGFSATCTTRGANNKIFSRISNISSRYLYGNITNTKLRAFGIQNLENDFIADKQTLHQKHIILFSCEGAALKVLMSVCPSVRLQC